MSPIGNSLDKNEQNAEAFRRFKSSENTSIIANNSFGHLVPVLMIGIGGFN